VGEAASLWALFVASFLAATLLPGGSEAVLFGVLRLDAENFWPALGIATLGNTLGGLSSYLVGRLIPWRPAAADAHKERWRTRALAWTSRFGPVAMLASWVPLIGDPLCVAAGCLRLDWRRVTLYMAAGKFARYFAVAAAAV